MDEQCLKELEALLMEKSKIDKVINAFRNTMYQEFSVEDSVNEEGMGSKTLLGGVVDSVGRLLLLDPWLVLILS